MTRKGIEKVVPGDNFPIKPTDFSCVPDLSGAFGKTEEEIVAEKIFEGVYWWKQTDWYPFTYEDLSRIGVDDIWSFGSMVSSGYFIKARKSKKEVYYLDGQFIRTLYAHSVITYINRISGKSKYLMLLFDGDDPGIELISGKRMAIVSVQKDYAWIPVWCGRQFYSRKFLDVLAKTDIARSITVSDTLLNQSSEDDPRERLLNQVHGYEELINGLFIKLPGLVI